jgi:predicted DNA-binding ribbon-helix-helix protein
MAIVARTGAASKMNDSKPIEISEAPPLEVATARTVLTHGAEGIVVQEFLSAQDSVERDGNPEIVKRSVVVAGHKTSVSLEDAFWHALKDIARERSVSLRGLVAEIDSNRRGGNLSSAVRLHVLDHYRRRSGAVDSTAEKR